MRTNLTTSEALVSIVGEKQSARADRPCDLIRSNCLD